MNRRSFLTRPMAPALGAGLLQARKTSRPNILVVLMDDFGIGHFAPHAETVNTESFDPAYVHFLKAHKAGYEGEEALQMARRAMPVISAMAKQGVVFSQAYAPSNLCAPSRAGILTGRSPNRFGVYNNIDFQRTGLPPGSVLAGKLRDAGYATALIGKYHVGTRDESLRDRVLAKHSMKPGDLARLAPEARAPIEREISATGFTGSVIDEHHPLNHGFDYYFGYNHHECPFYDSEHVWENRTFTGVQRRYNTELFADKAIQFTQRAKADGKPFFIELAVHAVHGPLKPKAPDKHFNRFPSQSYDLSNFFAHVNAVDAAIGAIRDAVGPEEWRNTLFLFTSDNGAPVSMQTPLPGNAPHRGHKGNYHLGGVRVPLMLHWPARVKQSRKSTALTSTLDVMPTALEAAGVKLPSGLDGKSLLPLATGAARQTREHLFWAGIHARAWGYTGETTIGVAQARREESPGAWVIVDGSYLLRFTGKVIPGLFKDARDGAPARFELYDLREDPGETQDVSAQLPQVVDRLKKIYTAEARALPAPAVWRRDRWQELMPSQTAF